MGMVYRGWGGGVGVGWGGAEWEAGGCVGQRGVFVFFPAGARKVQKPGEGKQPQSAIVLKSGDISKWVAVLLVFEPPRHPQKRKKNRHPPKRQAPFGVSPRGNY